MLYSINPTSCEVDDPGTFICVKIHKICYISITSEFEFAEG